MHKFKEPIEQIYGTIVITVVMNMINFAINHVKYPDWIQVPGIGSRRCVRWKELILPVNLIELTTTDDIMSNENRMIINIITIGVCSLC